MEKRSFMLNGRLQRLHQTPAYEMWQMWGKHSVPSKKWAAHFGWLVNHDQVYLDVGEIAYHTCWWFRNPAFTTCYPLKQPWNNWGYLSSPQLVIAGFPEPSNSIYNKITRPPLREGTSQIYIYIYMYISKNGPQKLLDRWIYPSAGFLPSTVSQVVSTHRTGTTGHKGIPFIVG